MAPSAPTSGLQVTYDNNKYIVPSDIVESIGQRAGAVTASSDYGSDIDADTEAELSQVLIEVESRAKPRQPEDESQQVLEDLGLVTDEPPRSSAHVPTWNKHVAEQRVIEISYDEDEADTLFEGLHEGRSREVSVEVEYDSISRRAWNSKYTHQVILPYDSLSDAQLT